MNSIRYNNSSTGILSDSAVPPFAQNEDELYIKTQRAGTRTVSSTCLAFSPVPYFEHISVFLQVVFNHGKVYVQNRFVSTEGWDPDAPEGRRSAGAVRAWTARPGGWLKNVLRLPVSMRNTNVMVEGGKLYALYEGGKPTEMDPVTLDTLGERDLGGIKVQVHVVSLFAWLSKLLLYSSINMILL